MPNDRHEVFVEEQAEEGHGGDSPTSTSQGSGSRELVRLVDERLPLKSISALDRVLADAILEDRSITGLHSAVGMVAGAALAAPTCILLTHLLALIGFAFTPPWAGILTIVFIAAGSVLLQRRQKYRALGQTRMDQVYRAKARYQASLEAITDADLSSEKSELRRVTALDKHTQELDRIFLSEENQHD